MMFEITIPVLNEEATLAQNIEKVIGFLKESSIKSFRVVIADNGSTDNTELIGKHLETKFKDRLKFLKVHKKGVGLALRTSWVESNADIVGYMDLDLATDLQHIEEVFKIFQTTNVEIVNGSRLLKSSKVVNRTIQREFVSRCFNFIMRLILGIKISDGMCGFKFFRSHIAKKLINTGIETDGWIFSTEILAKAEWSKHIIYELPVRWKDDQTSKVKVLQLSKEYLKHLLKMKNNKSNWIKNNCAE